MVDRKGVITYLLLAFGIAWVTWEVPIRLLHLDVTSPKFQLFALPGAFAPAIAALIVRAITPGGWKDAKFRLPLISKWPFFLFGILLPLFVLLVMAAEAGLFGLLPAGFDLSQALQGVVPHTVTAGQDATAGQLSKFGPWLIPSLLGMAILFVPVLWGEEFGWRGYLQPRLFPGRPLLAGVTTGVIWAVWHFPLILRGYDYGPEQGVIGCFALIVSSVLLSIIFGWLVDRTGSIWSSSLAHSATNMIGGSLGGLWFAGVHNPALASYAGALAWPPLLLVAVLILVFGYRNRGRDAVAEQSGLSPS